MFTPEVERFFTTKRVLVTGGAGFIGSHLVEMLVDLGAKVTVPIRKSTLLDYLTAVSSRIRVIEADLNDRASVDRAMRDQEVVLHLAAAKGGGIAHSMAHHGSLFRDNMASFINVLDVAREQSVPRFLMVSSACVYPRDSKVPTSEDEGTRDMPEATNAGYGWSKRMEEYLTLAFSEEFGMNVRIARPFNAYGPRDDFFRETNHVIPGLITRVLRGDNPLVVWGSGKQTRSFLYVTDFARGLLEVCAQDNTIGPVNLGSDEEVAIGDLARLIVELSEKKVAIVFDATKPDGQPRRTCDVTTARRLVGFEAKIPLRRGLVSTIAWYQRGGHLRGMAQ